MNRLVLKLLAYPPIGKLALNMAKKRVLKPFQISVSEAMDKQENMLKEKFKRMEKTEIGRKLGVGKTKSLQELSITDYNFYEPFLNSPVPEAFMYPIEAYERVRTSGTAGKEKWFMIPRTSLVKSTMETGVSCALLFTHNGEKITVEYGDTFYVNTAPRPFALGTMVSVTSGESGKFPLFNVVPNFNLPFEDKVQYFINNYEEIDVATIQASILVSKIMPSLKKTIKLKGLFCPDTPIAEAYFDEISRFAGTAPKTFFGSTETLGCSIPSVQHPLGFILDWRRGIFEFIPVKDGKTIDKAVMIDDVKVGETYQVVYTSLDAELTRYNLFNAFKCVGKGDDVLGIDHPVFKFHARLEKTISLHNFTRISEDELIIALRENQIPFVEFTAREEIENGLEFLKIYIETTEDKSEEEIQELIHKWLYNTDRDYKDLVDFYGYLPIKISLMPQGVFAKYLSTKVAAVSKVDRIKMRDEDFKKLMKLCK